MSMTNEFNRFAGKLLVSRLPETGTLNDVFHRAVVLVLESDAFGVTGVDLAHAVEDLATPVLRGGPMRHFTLMHQTAERDPEGGHAVEGAPFVTFVSSFRDEQQPYAQVEKLVNPKLAIGVAGWDADQLQAEIDHGFWHVMDATPDLVFDTPADGLYDACVRKAKAPAPGPN